MDLETGHLHGSGHQVIRSFLPDIRSNPSDIRTLRSGRSTVPEIRSTGRDVSVTKGKQAYLDCRVDNLQVRHISLAI